MQNKYFTDSRENIFTIDFECGNFWFCLAVSHVA